jgi:purine-cytosine permease-like protein
MRAKNKTIIPPELARKISPWMVNSAEMTGAVGKTALIGGMVLSLYGPDHNGFLFLLGPWICPTLIAVFWSALFARRRFRIYRGSPFAEHSYVDTGDDPVVMHLAELFNSDEARRHLWHETVKLSSILFAILGTAAFFLRDSLSWAYPSTENHFFWTARRGVAGYWFWPGLFMCSLFAFLGLVSDFYRWCLMTWAKRESAHHVLK